MRLALRALLLAVALAGPAAAAPRPGPDLLYARPAVAPQLQNTGVWKARPILVSGATAYRRGEFVYQDFLFDDHGARQRQDPGDPRFPGQLFALPNGTYTYPTDERYAANAADLVELRVRPLAHATAVRLTLNTLRDPALVAASLALGGTPGTPRPFPAGANVSAPADRFVTVHAGGAEITDAASGDTVLRVPVAIDAARRQIEVRIPHAAWDPGRRVARMAAGVGLWDAAAKRYLLPGGAADAATPGGAGDASAPAAFFNVAFRIDEPWPDRADAAGQVGTAPAWWRDRAQGAALAAGDISRFSVPVDFGKLAARARDDSRIPRTGPMDRILAAHDQADRQGADFGVSCDAQKPCDGQFGGQLQPYYLYVPVKPAPPRGYGLTLLMLAATANHNLYGDKRHSLQFGDRGRGHLVVTPSARGGDGNYAGLAEASVFEAWADVARRYPVDRERVVAAGTSMGGIGAFKLAEQFPDLFARIHSTVGQSGDDGLLGSLRHVPVMGWFASSDETTPGRGITTTAALDRLGYRYVQQVFAPADHLALDVNDEFGPAADWLGDAARETRPAHVTYVVDPTLDRPDLGLVADHAYWLGRVRLASTEPGAGRPPYDPLGAATQEYQDDPLGAVDARSEGFGAGDPAAAPTVRDAGTLSGGTLGDLAFTRATKTWGTAPAAAVADVLHLATTNVRSLRVSARAARLTCAPTLDVEADSPLTLSLGRCPRTRSRIALPVARGRALESVTARVGSGRARRYAVRGNAITVRRRGASVHVVATFARGLVVRFAA